MASEEVLDFERLLAPIPGEKPAGEDLRENFSPTAIYHQIKDIRNRASADERQLAMFDPEDEDAGPPPRPDWRPLVKMVPETLAEKSKDLEITAWLIESLLRCKGFPGLRDGFRLARELIENFWEDVFPLPDEDGLEARIYPLTGLNGQDSEGTLITPINNVPITEEHDLGPYANSHFEQALDLERVSEPDKRQRRIDEGAISKGMFDKAARATSPEFFRNLVDDLQACLDEFAKLGALLDEKCGPMAPPTSNIRNALVAVQDTVRSISKSVLGSDAIEGAEGEAEATEGAPAAGGGSGVAVGAVRNRQDAFRNLLQVADFFRRTEPHSPVSYALEQVVRWGKMSLPELWAELIMDESTRDSTFRQVGIQEPTSED